MREIFSGRLRARSGDSTLHSNQTSTAPVVLYPNDVWTVGASWDSTGAIDRYLADIQRLSKHKPTTPECIEETQLQSVGLAAQTFIPMSDPPFGMYTKNGGFAHETVNFDFVIATANRLNPAFVIVTGDLINKPGDAAQAAEYKRIATKPACIVSASRRQLPTQRPAMPLAPGYVPLGFQTRHRQKSDDLIIELRVSI